MFRFGGPTRGTRHAPPPKIAATDSSHELDVAECVDSFGVTILSLFVMSVHGDNFTERVCVCIVRWGRYGGKAAGLVRMSEHGCVVPVGVAIGATALEHGRIDGFADLSSQVIGSLLHHCSTSATTSTGTCVAGWDIFNAPSPTMTYGRVSQLHLPCHLKPSPIWHHH
jgi:hypothetical protein